MTPEGHPESGWVTFSAADDAGAVVAQVQTMARAYTRSTSSPSASSGPAHRTASGPMC